MPCVVKNKKNIYGTTNLSGSYQHLWTRFKGWNQAKCSFLPQPKKPARYGKSCKNRAAWSKKLKFAIELCRQYLRNDSRLKEIDDEKYDKSHGSGNHSDETASSLLLAIHRTSSVFYLIFSGMMSGSDIPEIALQAIFLPWRSLASCQVLFSIPSTLRVWYKQLAKLIQHSPHLMVEYYVSNCSVPLLTFLLSITVVFSVGHFVRGVTLPWLDWMVIGAIFADRKRGLLSAWGLRELATQCSTDDGMLEILPILLWLF